MNTRFNNEAVDEAARRIAEQITNVGLATMVLEPGNATRYDLAFAVVGGPITAGHPSGALLVALTNYNSSALLPMNWIAPSYLQEKLGVTGGDAEVLSALIDGIGVHLRTLEEG